MKLKTSLFKKGLIISDLKRFWWVSACYALALFFILPLNHYMKITNSATMNENNKDWLKEVIAKELTFKNGVSQLLLLIVPVLIGALIFRYMQKGRSASLYHSLPLTRAGLYLNSILSSLILLIVPLIFNTIIMLLLNGFSSLSEYYSGALIFKWLLYSLLFGILFLSMSVFVGMFTGNSIAQIAFVYILNILPVFLVEFVRLNLSQLLYGFNDYSNMSYYYRLPIFILYFNRYEHFSAGLIWFYILLTAALLAGALFAFKIRKPETAGDIITFKPFRPIFIFGITVCTTLLGGTYFIHLGNNSPGFIIFGYFICSLISFVIAQMITNKTLKVLHTYKGYLGFALVLILLLLGVKFDILGYVNKVPDPSNVEEAYLGYNINWWREKETSSFNNTLYGNYDTTVYKESQNIENFVKLHQLILDNKGVNGPHEFIAYKLKNGKRIIRHYTIDQDLYASALGPIYESREYKEGRFPILKQEAKDIKFIEITDERSEKSPFVISDKPSLESFKTAIGKDIDKLKYSSLAAQFQRSLTIHIIDIGDERIDYAIGPDYTNTIDWLKQQGIYDEVILKPEDVSSVVLNHYGSYTDNSGNPSSQQAKSVEITDKNVIQELIELSFMDDTKNKINNFSISFNSRNHSGFSGFSMSLDQKVSPELQSYIDKIK